MSFFKELQNHSEVKLSILEKYIIPWMRKIILNRYGPRKCLMIDGFAGAGTYDNGKKGSPTILIENSIDFYKQSSEYGWNDPEIYIYLNELDDDNYKKLCENVKSLGFITSDGMLYFSTEFKTIKISIENKKFEDFLKDILSDIKDGESLIPSFCFVDPFGFSTTSFDLFKEYLKNDRAELLINFMYEFTNRFIRHPNERIKQHISSHMGLIDLDTLIEGVENLDPADRKHVIINTYTTNILKETNAIYVRHFDIKKDGKTKMILFYVTKNMNGLLLMKETMWKHDETGQYVYNDKKEFVQLDFETALLSDKSYHVELLSKEVYKHFSKQKKVGIEQIENFIIILTDYPLTNFRQPALQLLEKGKLIANFTGRKRVNSYPKGTFMDFN